VGAASSREESRVRVFVIGFKSFCWKVLLSLEASYLEVETWTIII
jgi:hypothetical protein